MKISRLKRITKASHEIGDFLLFLIEESPAILAIIAIPTLLSVLVMLPSFSNFLSLFLSFYICLYLAVKKFRATKKFPSTTWFICLLVSFVVFIIPIALIESAAQTNIKLNLNYYSSK